MRTTTLITPLPFPSLTSRQAIKKRTTVELCPIEVATGDILDRNSEMKITLERRDEDCDENNMMRLVQGSIVPQVNAGMAATAEGFLKRSEEDGEFPPFDILHEHTDVDVLREKMRESVVTFTVLSAQLLLKSKRILHLDEDYERELQNQASQEAQKEGFEKIQIIIEYYSSIKFKFRNNSNKKAFSI